MPPVVAAAGGFITALTGGTIAFGAATSAFAFGVAAAGVLSSPLVLGALSIGVSLLLRPGNQGAAAINAPEVRGSIKQGTPPQRIIYGRIRAGGAMFFAEDSKPPYLYIGLLHCARRVQGARGYIIGNTPATFDATTGAILTSDFVTGGAPRMWLSARNGDPDQEIDRILDADFKQLGDGFRQRGTATTVFKAHYGADIDEFERLWGQVQIPNVLVDIDGALVHDPRDPSSDPDDESTWKFRRTAALIQADWLRQPYGGRQATSRMRWDEIADAANYDDQPCERADGTIEPRYTIDGMVTLDRPPAEIMTAFLGANRGFVCTHQGRIWVSSSRPQESVLTITDADLRGGFEYRASRQKAGLVNLVRTRFTSADREYQVVDGPIYRDQDLIDEDGEELEAALILPFTEGSSRAQRLADLALKETRLQRGMTCNLPTRRALGLRPGQAVTIESTIYPFMNGSYRVETIGLASTLAVMPIVLAEYDATIADQWTAANEQPFNLAEIDVT